MYAQLRIYTINPGRMDEWARWFHERLMPIAEAAGHTVIGPWASAAGTDFIWIRVYDSIEDAKLKDQRFYNSPEWVAIASEARQLIAKTEITEMSAI